MTEFNPIPGKDPALASRFATFDAAMLTADRIAEDDPEWNYNVERQGNYFVIAVYDDLGDADIIFLGYL